VYFAVLPLPGLFLCTTGANLFLAWPELTERPPNQTFLFVQSDAVSNARVLPTSKKHVAISTWRRMAVCDLV
jgi:hypothetical protein